MAKEQGTGYCTNCGTKIAMEDGSIGMKASRGKLAISIAIACVSGMLIGSLATIGVLQWIGAIDASAAEGVFSSQSTPPDIDGTWVSQGELDRPFTLSNGVITTSEVEDAPKKGTYVISDKPDDNGYYILDLKFGDMDECTSDTSDTLDSCKGKSFDITRFEIQTTDKGTEDGYVSSFSLRPVLSEKQKKKVKKDKYYDNCAWSLGYMWYNGGKLGDCAIDPSTFEPVKPEYWTMIRQ